jgi:hypothetical protein
MNTGQSPFGELDLSTTTLDGTLAALRESEIRLLTDVGTSLAEMGDIAQEDRHRLLAAVEAWALSRRLPEVSVRSNVLRESSHPFYEKHGYRRVKTQHAYRKAVGEHHG